MSTNPTNGAGEFPTDFIRSIINEDQAAGAYDGRVVTRFPPEPNGYLHIGHAKSICLNFGVGEQYQGARCHMRFDDTNPTREDIEYVESILADVKWLGFDWGENLFYASDYFEELYQYAEQLIRDRQRLHRQPHRRRNQGVSRDADRAGQGEPRSQPAGSRRAWTSSGGCGQASSQTESTCCARKSTWPRPT